MMLKHIFRYFSIFSLLQFAYGNEEVEKQIFDVIYYKQFVEEVALDNELYRGEYLIYDCETLHFACVNEDSFQLCGKKQQSAQELNEKNKSCLPIRKFKNQPKCFEQQYKANQKTSMKKFCLN